MYIISYLEFNEPKMKSFQNQYETLEYIKSVKNETVVEKIFDINRLGHVTEYKVVFDGKFNLQAV
ncbi:hypothetical protein [Cytobacillus oceanisediminis]|uniref:hypothetical protein n=1 Tax=Cytobacillus oceanisediminis TaxID=665099 RepID=UPI001C21669D|nr:hypothetical protein [Cytobacillus oceanisediminis]MBU8770333.1 hypothetical protein [Cytobacillus oceanisediminis]